jgi:hypothetical protein
MFHGHLGCFQTPPLGGRSNTKPGDHATPKSRSLWFILFYHEQRSASIEIHWNSIWLRAQSLMAAQYTWGSVTTLHEFGGVLGRPLDTFGLSQFHGHGSWLVCEVALGPALLCQSRPSWWSVIRRFTWDGAKMVMLGNSARAFRPSRTYTSL